MILLIGAPTRKSKKGKRRWSVANVSFWGEGIGLQKFKVENDYVMLSCCSHVWLCKAPWTIAHQVSLWDSPGNNTRVGCQGILQGVFPTQGSNPHLSISCIGWQVLQHRATWEAQRMITYFYCPLLLLDCFFFFNYCILWKVRSIPGKTGENTSKIE